MSFALTATSLSGATAGTTGSVDWTQIAQSAGFPDPGSQPHIQFFNESPCELQLNFSTGEQVMLPAGGWQTIALNAQCTRLTYQVLAVLNAAPIISDLFGTWYAPGEAVPQITTLGNSPIGGSTTTVTTQANELTGSGQTLGVTEVDSGGNPELVPFSGANAKLLLGALDGSGNPTTLTTLDAIANTVQINAQELTNANSNAGMEWGNALVANTPFIDFHSSGNAIDYDVRVIATGGSASPGNGFLQILGAGLQTPLLTSVGGQATAGAFGVPVVVAQLAPTHVTATSQQNLLVYACTATGLYRANFSFTYLQATSVKPIADVSWHSAQGSLTTAGYFVASSGTPGQALNGSQASAMGSNQDVGCAPITFYALTGTNITLQYQENGGTPNTWCYGTIERLS